ncbi:MAG: DUF1738 domain-containing protein [Flavobacteriaceae bacterium]|nr:DUF1738 domain-containing protein [Flavobacteriaceae bacterium]
MAYTNNIESFKASIEEIHDNLLKQMQSTNADWQMPWHKGIPYALNAKTGKHYGGNNLLILWNQCLINKYPNNRWATLKQWNKIGANVKKKAKGTLICIAIPKGRRTRRDIQHALFEPIRTSEIIRENQFFRFKFRHVFNESQVNGYYGSQPELFSLNPISLDIAKELVLKSKAEIVIGGESACYRIYEDRIQMPELGRFEDSEGYSKIENYYSTLVHELIHWTGHPTRCDRLRIAEFGSPAYAFEELVAEIGSALLVSQMKGTIVPRISHAKYLNSWLRALNSDFSYFVEALELSRTAVYYLNEKTGIYPYDLKHQHVRSVNEDRVARWCELSTTNNK